MLYCSCGGKTFINKTETWEEMNICRRRRVCFICGKIFWTTEKPPTENGKHEELEKPDENLEK